VPVILDLTQFVAFALACAANEENYWLEILLGVCIVI